MFQINIKPLSINQPIDPQYRVQLFEHFQKLDIPKVDPQEELFLFLEFGIDSRMDASNGIKRFEDCLVEYLEINDRKIGGIYTKKVIRQKGDEYIRFNLFAYEHDLLEFIKTEL